MAPKFSKQSILDYHHNRVEILEVEHGALLQEKIREEQKLEILKANEEKLSNELNEMLEGVLDLEAINQTRFNIRQTQKLIEYQIGVIERVQIKVDEKKKELIEAKQDEAVFEKLKEKEKERYDEKVLKSEKDQQADIYIALTNRKMSVY